MADDLNAAPPRPFTTAEFVRGLLRSALRLLIGARPDRPADEAPPDGLRETVETLVFVIVVVLMLRSFDAEAFVIPTGSMAQTLLGYQKWVECPSCGYRFPVNCSQQIEPNEEGKLEWVSGCTCPNCRQHVSFTGQNYGGGNAPGAAVPDPDWGSGDRVLVSKFAYDLTDKPPDRYDVVVFKFPGDGDVRRDERGDYLKRDHFPLSGPFKDGTPMNFIKRLVGLPGETIAIHGGDLYYLPADQGPQYDDLQGFAGAERDDRARQLWMTEYEHQNDTVDRFRAGDFTILRKPPDVLLAERRIVCDNDHPARDLTGPAWARWAGRDPSSGWKDDGAHGFRLPAPSDDGGKVQWLGYRHILRDRPGKPQLITDFMGYDTVEPSRGGPSGANWVGDLILDCDVQADQPAGELTLELSKGVDRFQARFDLASGVCTLYRLHAWREESLGSQPTGLKGGGTHAVRFANVDRRLTVWADNALPFGDGVAYEAANTEGPTEKNDLLEPAGVALKGVGGTVSGLRLWRDTYYTIADRDNPKNDDPAAPDAGPGVDFADPATWGALRRLHTRTLYVQPGHYLCLGDNSPCSFDGRFWGLVPERLLLGKALDVYYPFDRFGRIR